MKHHITTPFGRRTLTAAQIQAQAIADGCSADTTVHKWTVFRDVAVVRSRLGLNDRAIAVLDALLTFHPETVLTVGEGADLVVFPSNAALTLRAHGIAEATLRRSLAALTEAGLIIRRDSPNGKRYVRRSQGGVVAQAFGFDLSPLIARAAELACLAEAVRAEAQALRVSRERTSILRRDCAKLILALEEAEGGPGAAESLRARYKAILSALPRQPIRPDLDAAGEALTALAIEMSNLLIAHQESSEMHGNADQTDRHIQSSNPDTPDPEQAAEMAKKEAPAPGEGRGEQAERCTTRNTYPLGFVIDACPDINAFARDGIRTWRDLAATADLARSALGISPDAWREARDVMGEDAAAVTVAAILQRVDHIRSPGGYLRALVERKRGGQFSLGPILQALNRARLARPGAGAGLLKEGRSAPSGRAIAFG
ncbi:plasmid replication protein RepC [Methylobacterium sp. NEAU 140]|uniref:plasmid replication protein RepC n=1 Tax=Methylobacterium sp. NEAU 140 TaxID=3064945 RepID=UPI0027369588|nr:plasmid replication protein RepC [Methylobacterium sp. NEAU 140]MDP4026989.1 plasmid replication protein RepC [Methylobacterium sp. NEAU 140]